MKSLSKKFGSFDLSKGESISDAPKDRNQFINATEFEREKFNKYIYDITEKLNSIHNLSKTLRFWETTIGFVLLMQYRIVDVFLILWIEINVVMLINRGYFCE